MKFRLFAKSALVVAGFVLFSGCTSCRDVEPENSNRLSETKVIKPKRSDNSAWTNSNTNAQAKTYPGLENGKNPTLDNSKVKVINTANAPVPLPPRRMPDNSEVSTTMNSEGAFVESRRFLDHPVLERLERITVSPKNVKVRVRLRSGKAVDIVPSKIKNFRFESADTILKAAGVAQASKAEKGSAAEKEEIMKRKSVKDSQANR